MDKITSRIDPELKAELDGYCEQYGVKQGAVVSAAIAAWLEDAQDVALVEARRGGPWVEWDAVKRELDL